MGGYICGEAGIVTNANDSGPGSLRDMLAYGCFDTITFAGDYTIYLSSTLTISDELTIDGSGHTVTLSGDSNGDGSRDLQVMVITSTGAVTLSHLNIVSGTANSGGGIYNLGTLTLLDSALADNTATYGGGLSIGTNARAMLSNSTIVNNYATMSGGGIEAGGLLTVTHVTVAGNSADDSNGAGGLENTGTLYAYNTILADNSGLFANNCSLSPDVTGFIAVNINNLIEGDECNSGATLSGLLGDDPQLGALDYHGGNTLNYALTAASPALETASATYCPALDQRGVGRPQGAGCDRGAFELEQSDLILTKQVTPTNVAPGGWLTYTLLFTNIGAGESANPVITDDLPAEILSPTYTWSLDGGATLTHTANTTYSWSVSGTLGQGQGGIITVTGQLSTPLAADLLTNTATLAEIQGGDTVSATAEVGLAVDNVAPVVAGHIFTIAESSAVGDNVGIVTGTDDNLDVVAYTITAGNSDGIFAINGSSGQITVANTVYLNYEADDLYILTVAATDGELTGTHTVEINITDTATDLKLSKSVIPATADPGASITYTLSFTNTGDDKAGDAVIFDESLGHLATITYQFSLNNDVTFSQPDSTTYVWEMGDIPAQTNGVLTVTGILSQPLAAGILTNTATITTTSDESNTADNVATTTLTINDVDPILTPTVFTVSEAAANGTIVGVVNAVDNNGESLTYNLIAGNEDGIFALNSVSGLITVANRTNLSYETTPQYVLIVEVSVGTFVDTTTVTVDVSDVDIDLSLVKTANSLTAQPGEPLTYTLAFSNAGALTATTVVITDLLPSELTNSAYQTATDPGINLSRIPGITYAWTISELQPGQGGVITMTGVVTQPLAEGTRFTNTAILTTTTSEDTGPGPNRAEVGLTVGPVAPVIGQIALQTITETSTLTFTVSVSDGNGDSLSYGLSNPSAGMSIDSTGIFSWTPTEAQGPGTYLVSPLVTDTSSLTAFTVVMVSVIEQNEAPVLAAVAPQTIGVFETLTFTLAVTDTDLPANSLTYSLINPPGSTAIEAATGLFSWTPAEAGIYTLTVQVADDGQPILTDTTEVSITADVTPPDISGMVLITPTGGITLTTPRPAFDWEDAIDSQSGVISYTLLITGSNDSISLQEAGANITATQSAFTPTIDLAVGVYTWTVQAHDAAGNASDWVEPATFNIAAESRQLWLPLIMRSESSE